MIGEFRRRLLFLLNLRRFSRELEEEMRFHVEMTGQPQFGNLTLLIEDSRAVWGFGRWERLWQDLRYGARTLRNSPAFTAVAVITLALGIGANTAVFSLIDALVLRSLPVRHPEQLFALTRANLPASSLGSFNITTLSVMGCESSVLRHRSKRRRPSR